MTQLFASGGQSIGNFSFNISPSNEHPELICFRMDWLDLLAVQGTLKRRYIILFCIPFEEELGPCFMAVILEKTLESPLDSKEIQPVHSERDQPWDFFGRNDAEAGTPVLWPPHAMS